MPEELGMDREKFDIQSCFNNLEKYIPESMASSIRADKRIEFINLGKDPSKSKIMSTMESSIQPSAISQSQPKAPTAQNLNKDLGYHMFASYRKSLPNVPESDVTLASQDFFDKNGASASTLHSYNKTIGDN